MVLDSNKSRVCGTGSERTKGCQRVCVRMKMLGSLGQEAEDRQDVYGSTEHVVSGGHWVGIPRVSTFDRKQGQICTD